jgi:DNA topoisomerase-1
MKKLIIVESPAKAKTIKNFLGKEYEVIASKGHIRDLPKRKMGVKVEEGHFIPEYTVSADHKPHVKQINDLAKKCDEIYIATDEDREGEAIGWHIAMALKKDPESLPRIVFHEITKGAINNALENPRRIDMSSVNAQQARRILDRLVGYNLSPLLGSKIQKGLSAGRVQSSSLKLVVEREREIKAFIPEEFWTIDALFAPKLEAKLYSIDGSRLDKFTINNETLAKEVEARFKNASYSIAKLEKKERKSQPNAPFMTSTLQQTASSALGYSPKKTMMLAQKLYEGVQTESGTTGVITYMRTDSLYIAPEANEAAREHIVNMYGDKYLTKETRIFKTKSKQAQEAHEAIRPSNIAYTPQAAATFLKPDEYKLYALIYNRFIASQMSEAIMETQNLFIGSDNGALFKASGKRLVFDGYYKAIGVSDKDNLLPELKAGEPIDMNELKANQHFTEPPSRFSEAGLVRELESLGIGRPSTYAPTISTLQTRMYIDIEKKQIIPTKIAFTVTEMLEEHFPEIVDSGFTANMEDGLDAVSDEGKDWEKLLHDFYEPFIAKVKEGKKSIKSLKIADPIGEKCPECGEELLKRSGRFGEFISCSAFPKCKYTRNIVKEGEEEEAPELTDKKCSKCDSAMIVKSGRNGKFYACSNYPECKNTEPLTPPKSLDVPCPKCGGEILERKSRRGVFFGCANYPKCDFISNFQPTKKKCPECGGIMGERTFRKKEIYECCDNKCKHRIDREVKEQS